MVGCWWLQVVMVGYKWLWVVLGGYGWLLGGIPSPLPPLAFHMFHVSEVTIIGQTLGKTTEVLSVSGWCFQFCQTQVVTSSHNTFALFETLLYSSNFARHTKSQVQVVPGNMHFAILYDANAIKNTLPATHTYKFRQSARGQRSVWLQDQLTEFSVSFFHLSFFLVSRTPSPIHFGKFVNVISTLNNN